MTREEMDAKIAATEARMEATEHRIDAALARLEAGSSAAFAEINTTLRHLPTSSTLYATVGGAVVAGILAVIAVLSFGGDRFDGGVQLTSASVQAATDAQALSKQNAQQIELLTGRINDVLKALAPRQEPPPPTGP
ncbi:hypothetical protein [Ancylobacter sp.]|uniref:hypothetical protein n=1 Tax=Ancylobacter sp. TaxID=1872567 RepID=UPI003D14F1B2